MRPGFRLAERSGYMVAAASVAVATAAFMPGREHFAKGQWSLLYLLVVAFVAGVGGARPALVSAVLSFFAWNFFFLPPYQTLHVADWRDWLSLCVFLIVGVLIGVQTGRLRDREAQARAREGETSLLNRFSAFLVSDVTVADMAARLVAEVRAVTGAGEVAVLLPAEGTDGWMRVASAGGGGPLPSRVTDVAVWVNREAKAVGLPSPPIGVDELDRAWPITADRRDAGAMANENDLFLPLQTATRQSGVLWVGERSDKATYTFHEARMVVALAHQASVFLERTALRAVAVEADALKETDRLKSTLISAVSHELKTPLASLQATVSNLLETDVRWDESRTREELQAVKQDLDRLGASIDSLLDLSRLEAAAWRPQKDAQELGDILATALSRLSASGRDRVDVSLPATLPPLVVDFTQAVRVLEHLLRNALAYSGAASPVRVGASATPNEVRFWVEDEGPGVAPEERERIFSKFYRGRTAQAAPAGTGLGLAISREIVRAHDGRIWVEDVAPHGARFVVAVPITTPGSG